ncbi:MAG: hypothetical protein HC773_05140 [Scytonema sp. CRU_2_7]|nr:hypothetical protein [Scytonema sp. CRU_2_7]
MENIYTYSREELGSVGWNINNFLSPMTLAKQIELLFPGKIFSVECNGDVCKIIFAQPLNVDEQNELDLLVQDHKSYSDLSECKNRKKR